MSSSERDCYEDRMPEWLATCGRSHEGEGRVRSSMSLKKAPFHQPVTSNRNRFTRNTGSFWLKTSLGVFFFIELRNRKAIKLNIGRNSKGMRQQSVGQLRMAGFVLRLGNSFLTGGTNS